MKNLAKRLHGDETLVKTYKKGLFFYFWALRCKGMEPVGWHMSETRNMHETKLLLWEACRRFPILFAGSDTNRQDASVPFCDRKSLQSRGEARENDIIQARQQHNRDVLALQKTDATIQDD